MEELSFKSIQVFFDISLSKIRDLIKERQNILRIMPENFFQYIIRIGYTNKIETNERE